MAGLRVTLVKPVIKGLCIIIVVVIIKPLPVKHLKAISQYNKNIYKTLAHLRTITYPVQIGIKISTFLLERGMPKRQYMH